MDIKTINGDYIKLGKTSIIVKKQEDISKTKGVITNCTIVTKNCSPRTTLEIHQKLSKYNLRIIFDKMVLNNGDLFYLYDLSLEDFISETIHIEEEQKLCEDMGKAGVIVIKCRIIK